MQMNQFYSILLFHKQLCLSQNKGKDKHTMIQDPNTQTNNPNNDIIELVNGEELQAIRGGEKRSSNGEPPPAKKARIEPAQLSHNAGGVCSDCIHAIDMYYLISKANKNHDLAYTHDFLRW